MNVQKSWSFRGDRIQWNFLRKTVASRCEGRKNLHISTRQSARENFIELIEVGNIVVLTPGVLEEAAHRWSLLEQIRKMSFRDSMTGQLFVWVTKWPLGSTSDLAYWGLLQSERNFLSNIQQWGYVFHGLHTHTFQMNCLVWMLINCINSWSCRANNTTDMALHKIKICVLAFP